MGITFKSISVLVLVLFVISLEAISQPDMIITDERDGQIYRFKSINQTIWMLDNLNYETQLSIQADPGKEYTPNGRFYHIAELDSICPNGWNVSSKEDWLSYFEYLIDNSSDTTLRITENKTDEIIEIDYWGKLDVFNDINPLEISHTGWVEGGNWVDQEVLPPPNANFWVLEPDRDELERTHVHVQGDIRIRIHRHKHNLNPNKEKNLRQFMVRCVKSE